MTHFNLIPKAVNVKDNRRIENYTANSTNHSSYYTEYVRALPRPKQRKHT